MSFKIWTSFFAVIFYNVVPVYICYLKTQRIIFKILKWFSKWRLTLRDERAASHLVDPSISPFRLWKTLNFALLAFAQFAKFICYSPICQIFMFAPNTIQYVTEEQMWTMIITWEICNSSNRENWMKK